MNQKEKLPSNNYSLTLNTYYDTIKNINGITEINIQDMLAFKNSKITEEAADKYVNIMTELTEKINNLNTSHEEKEKFRALFTMLFSKMCEADCKGLMLSDSVQKNRKYMEIIKQLHADFQQERDEHNKVLKKYNETEKAKNVDFPGFNLSLSLKSNKTLRAEECTDLMNKLELDDKEFDEKYKRIPVPNDFKNKVDRAYAKPSNKDGIIVQKTKK